MRGLVFSEMLSFEQCLLGPGVAEILHKKQQKTCSRALIVKWNKCRFRKEKENSMKNILILHSVWSLSWDKDQFRGGTDSPVHLSAVSWATM